MIDVQRVNKAILAAANVLTEQGVTGEEYLFVLQTLVANALAANDVKVKRIWLENLSADVQARRIAQLKKAGGVV